jgi:diguanylate cyclase (GGDEF)-like protein
LILYDAKEETVQKIIDKLLKNIRTTPILLDNNKSVNITASLGIYTFIPNEKDSLYKALINADKALYVAKKTGRNKAVFY